jgi:hypothetical protein
MPTAEEAAHLLEAEQTPYGVVRHLRPVGGIEGCRLRWTTPPPLRPGGSPAN